jgi:hypothetical protein
MPELEEFWLFKNFYDDDMKAVFDLCCPPKRSTILQFFSVRGKTRSDGKHKYDYYHFNNLPPLRNDEPLHVQFSLI